MQPASHATRDLAKKLQVEPRKQIIEHARILWSAGALGLTLQTVHYWRHGRPGPSITSHARTTDRSGAFNYVSSQSRPVVSCRNHDCARSPVHRELLSTRNNNFNPKRVVEPLLANQSFGSG